MEIRQDINSLRYELIDILRNNGMQTPHIEIQDVQGASDYLNVINILVDIDAHFQ